jgi:hypothetical protein
MLENSVNNNDYLTTIGLIGAGVGVIIVFAYTCECRWLHPLESAQLSPTEAQNFIGHAADTVDSMKRMLGLLDSLMNDLIRNTADSLTPVVTQEILDIRERIVTLGWQASSYLDNTAPIVNSLSRQAYLTFDDTCSSLEDCHVFLDDLWTIFNSF